MNAWGVFPQKVKQMFKATLKVENIDLSGKKCVSQVLWRKKHPVTSDSGRDLDSVKKKNNPFDQPHTSNARQKCV